jgi:hypothetical protein
MTESEIELAEKIAMAAAEVQTAAREILEKLMTFLAAQGVNEAATAQPVETGSASSAQQNEAP